MGLINSATSDCRIITEGKSVTYSKSKVQQTYSIVSGPTVTTYYFMWEYRRFCTAQYKYVGLSYDAAIRKQNELVTLYTRPYKVSDWVPDNGDFRRISGGKRLMAQIQVNKTVGHIYEVDIVLNEEDCIMKKTGSYDPASLFTEENRRSYEV